MHPQSNGTCSQICKCRSISCQHRVHVSIGGGPGSPSNGGTADYTEQQLPALASELSSFPGQVNSFGHYTSQGAYHLVHVVEFDDGCRFQSIWDELGAAGIDLANNSAVTVCYPDSFRVSFDRQAPGTLHTITWDNDGATEFVYPNLPVFPNNAAHLFLPSCNEENVGFPAEPYEIEIVAQNQCLAESTENQPDRSPCNRLRHRSFPR